MHHDSDFTHLDYIASPVFVLAPTPQDGPVYAAFNAYARDVANRPLTDYLGKTALEIYGGDMGKVAYDHHVNVAHTGTPDTYELELPIGTKTRLVRTTLVPVKDAEGRVTLIFGSSVDRSAEREARESRVEIDTLTGEMEQFVAMAAHDLRSPLRNVGELATMLREDFVDHGDGKIDLIDMLEDIAGRTMELITDILSHARATTAKEQVSRFCFGSLCRDIFAVLDPLSQHRLIVADADLHTDRAALQIVLRNLMENALKHGNRASLTLNATVTAPQDSWIEVQICDDGQGFDNPGHVFLETGHFRVDSGYGMLGIHRLIKARNGDITAANRPEGGSQVTFTLPGNLAKDPALPHRDLPGQNARQSGSAAGPI